ncbi:MAG: hypothetical protein EP330_24185 [Deltaproteobacteria bacterium]|nr:MAG: hypothetical protein EP330_24185 [Deltaproteobacteria bacterium]
MTRLFFAAGLLLTAPAYAEPASFVLGLHAGPAFALSPLDITALPRVTLGVELPPAQRRFRLWGGAAWAPPRSSGSVSDDRVPSGSFDYELRQQELMLGGGVAFAITNPEGPVVVDVEVGPQAFLLESRVDGSAGGEAFGEHREVYTRLGVMGALGIRIPAGPGEVAVQGLFTASKLDGRVTGDASSASISPSVGYRFVL